MEYKNVASVVENGLCCSCGVCSAACPKGAISFVYGTERNWPKVAESLCINCGLCVKTCPGKGVNLLEKSSSLFAESASYNKFAGYALHSYVGYSNDYEIRYHSASGGVVTEFLRYLLRINAIDGAVVIRYK